MCSTNYRGRNGEKLQGKFTMHASRPASYDRKSPVRFPPNGVARGRGADDASARGKSSGPRCGRRSVRRSKIEFHSDPFVSCVLVPGGAKAVRGHTAMFPQADHLPHVQAVPSLVRTLTAFT